MVSDIPAGDGKIINSFYNVLSSYEKRKDDVLWGFRNVPERGEKFFGVHDMLEKNSLEMILFVGPSANVLFKKFTFVFEHSVKLMQLLTGAE